MLVTMVKVFTSVLFLAIWLHSASSHASYQIDINNQALSSVRLNLWYAGLPATIEKGTKTNVASKEIASPIQAPEELKRALSKYLLAQ